MARTSAADVSLDVKFEVPESEIKRVQKILQSKFRIEAEDPLWVKNREKLAKLSKDIEVSKKNSVDLDKQMSAVDKRISKNVERAGKFKEKENKIEEKMSRLLDGIDKRREKASGQEKVRLDKRYEQIKNIAQTQINSNAEQEKSLRDQYQSADEEYSKLYDSIVQHKEDEKKLTNELLQSEKDRTSLLQEQRATQEAIARELMKMQKGLDYDTAMKQAKTMTSLSGKQTAFEKHRVRLLETTKKHRKEQLRADLATAKFNKEYLKKQGIGFFERRRMWRAERAQAFKSAGFSSKAAKEERKSISLREKAGAVMKDQMGGLVGTLAKLAGPLMALAGIGAFIMAMINANKQIKDAQKNVFKFAAISKTAWGSVQKGQTIGIKQLDGYVKTLDTMYDRVGLTFDEAVQGVGALTSAGVNFGDVMKNNGKLMVDVAHMATMSGMEFNEMAAISGEWVTEFGKQTSQLTGTFVDLMSAASRTNMTTTRFFSSVMNAAQGLAIYGTKVEDVSAVFADLVGNMKIPQKQATEIATAMLNTVDTMTSEQKVLVSEAGDAHGLLQKEITAMSSRKDLTADELKQLEHMKWLLNAQLDPLEKGVRLFEALTPADRLKAQLKALSSKIPALANVDAMNIGELKEVLKTEGVKLRELGKPFGMTDKFIMAIEKMPDASSFDDIGKSITDEEKKKAKAKMNEQADIIDQGTKSIQDILANKIAKFMRDIYRFLSHTLGPIVKGIWNWIKNLPGVRDKAETSEVNSAILNELERLNTQKESVTAEITDLETKLKSTKDPTKRDKISKQIQAKNLEVASITSRASGMQDRLKEIEKGKGKIGAQRRENMMSSIYESRRRDAAWAVASLSDTGEKQEGQTALNDISNAIQVEQNPEEAIKSIVSGLKLKKVQNIFKDAFGFAKGGYTGQGPSSQVAGLAHKGEFVFDKDSTMKAGPSNLKSLMQAIKFQSVPTAAALTPPMAIGATSTGTSGSTYNNNVVLNINQRDRQEIEQIVYKVLYDQKGR